MTAFVDPVLHRVSLTVNGTERTVEIDNRTSLLDLLRETLDLTGTKNGCSHGHGGACTVLVGGRRLDPCLGLAGAGGPRGGWGGRRVNACLVLGVALDGAEVVTVEGLADGDGLAPLQHAF